MSTYKCAKNHVYTLPFNLGKITCPHTTPGDVDCGEPSFLIQDEEVNN